MYRDIFFNVKDWLFSKQWVFASSWR